MFPFSPPILSSVLSLRVVDTAVPQFVVFTMMYEHCFRPSHLSVVSAFLFSFSFPFLFFFFFGLSIPVRV